MASSIGSLGNSVIGASGNLQGVAGGLASQLPPEMQDFANQQMQMNKMQEINQLVTQLIKAMHDMAMAIIKNIGGG